MRLLVAVMLVFCGCPTRSQVARLGEPHGLSAERGRYPGYVRMLSGTDPQAIRAERLRQDAETHESVLRRAVRDRFEVKWPLEFRFMYVGLDSVEHRLILRYFARHPDPTAIAGWQVQLVYALPGQWLTRAYVDEVPLE